MGQSPRRGATLIEMLVVIMILVLLAGVAVPVMRPAMQSRRPREAARAVNVYFSMARTRALELGRPVGVVIEPLSNQPLAAMVLSQFEAAPPYAGETLDCRMQVMINTTLPSGQVQLTARAVPSGSFNTALITAGDFVQFNHQGPLFMVSGNVADDQQISLLINLREGQQLPFSGAWSALLSYQFFPKAKKSAAAPLQLPAGMVIDLGFSGIDPDNPGVFTNRFDAGDGTPNFIMFSPNGSLGAVYTTSMIQVIPGSPPASPLYFLIGRNDKVGDATNPNWQDMNNRWVTINSQTGMVSTAPVDVSPNSGNVVPASVTESRWSARNAYSMGGG